MRAVIAAGDTLILPAIAVDRDSRGGAKPMRVLAIIALTIAGVVVGYKLLYPTYAFRYRMTVSVEEGGQVHSGSSVIEVKINLHPAGIMHGLYDSDVRGEAVFVDLGGQRNVIALMANGKFATNRDYLVYVVPQAFNLTFDDYWKLPHLSGSREIPPSRMPRFVTFGDPKDAKSARMVEPEEFPKVFGTEARPPKVTVEMTSDAVTCGITEKLPWLPGFKGTLGGGLGLDPSHPERSLTGGEFINGCAK